MAKRPILTMMVALQEGAAADPTAEVPLDVFIRDLRNESYLAIRSGANTVLLTEAEAEALVAAVRKLSILATALDSARDHIGKASQEDGR